MKRYPFLTSNFYMQTIYLLFALIIVNCSAPEKPISTYKNNTIFQPIDTLVLPIKQKYRSKLHSYTDLKTGASYISSINIEEHALEFFDMKGSLFKRVLFPFAKNEHVQTCYVHNFDSIFIDIDRKNYFYLINEKGEIVQKIDVETAKNCPPNGAWQFFGEIFRNNFYFQKNKLYFYGSDFSFGRKGIRYDIGKYGIKPDIEFILDIKINTLLNPDRGYIQPFTFPFRKDTYPGICYTNKGIIHSHSYSNYIYIFDEYKLIDSALFNSRHFVLPKPFDVNKYGDDLYDTDFFTTAHSYFSINYHPLRKIYLRSSIHGFKEIMNKDGSRNLPLDRAWSLIISDDNFNILEEIEFPQATFDYCNVLLVGEGILVSLNHELNPIYDENETKFLFLAFKK